ncbi:MFS general substrate transporter [Peniophora sp. CONT]|nr:MFS general substrate transporter [Peniophora sp. CONT]
MNVQRALQTPLLEHVEEPTTELNVPAQEPAPAVVDPEAARVQEQAERAHAAVYARFTEPQKRMILALVTFAGLTQMFVTSSFVTSIPAVAREFGSTPALINLAVSASIITTAFGMLVFSTYSAWYGRRPIFLTMLPILIIGSIGAAAARSVTTLVAWRVVQAFGASGGFAVGAGVIADVFPLEQRGRATGIFYSFAFLGPALAPFVGGAVAYYASWRIMQLSLGIASLIALILFAIFFPETSQPHSRGIDKLRAEGHDASERSPLLGERVENGEEKFKWVWLNPFGFLNLLRSPNVLAVVFTSTFVLMAEHTLLNPLAYTLGARYGIENEGLIGLCFLPSGVGNILGAPLAGRLSDIIVVRARAKRGSWVPEDRLRASVLGVAVLVPVSLLAFGLTIKFLPGTAGLVVCLVLLFLHGVGVDYALTPMSAYLVDILHSQSAQVVAAASCVRQLIIGLAITGVLPAIEHIGVVWTNAIVAGLIWCSLVSYLATIRYGDRMRAWIDVGYSDASNN